MIAISVIHLRDQNILPQGRIFHLEFQNLARLSVPCWSSFASVPRKHNHPTPSKSSFMRLWQEQGGGGGTYSQVRARACCTKTSTEQRRRLPILPLAKPSLFHRPSSRLLKGHSMSSSAEGRTSISAHLATRSTSVSTSPMPRGKTIPRLVLQIQPCWHLPCRTGRHSLAGAESGPPVRSPTKGRIHKD